MKRNICVTMDDTYKEIAQFLEERGVILETVHGLDMSYINSMSMD